MDIIVLTVVVLAGVALENYIIGRAQKRAERESMIIDRLVRYASREPM